MRAHIDTFRTLPARRDGAAVAAQQGEQQIRHGLWVCNISGTIVSCSQGAAHIFGGSIADLEGRSMWSLIFDAASGSTPPSYKARHIAYLARDGTWHRFLARDAAGLQFPIELAVSAIGLNESTGFMVRLRQVAAHGTTHQSGREIGSDHE